MKKLITCLTPILAVLVFMYALVSCTEEQTVATAPLTITSVEPLTARAGDTIRIIGTGFSAARWKNELSFYQTTGFVGVAAATEKELKVIVPRDVVTGPIELRVGDAKVLSEQSFTLDLSMGAPKITSIAPKNAGGGATVTLNGINFTDGDAVAEVFFGTLQAEVLESSETRLKVKVPYGLREGNVSVKAVRASLTSYAFSFIIDPPPAGVKTTYWSDGAIIYKGNITPTGMAIELLYDLTNDVRQAKGVTLNPADGMLYFIGGTQSTPRAVVMRAPADGSGPVEKLYSRAQLFSFIINYDIALDPANSTLFVSVAGSNEAGNSVDRIIKASYADLTAPIEIFYENTSGFGGDVAGLKIVGSVLYWTESVAGRIMKKNVDGSPEVVLFDKGDNLVVPINVAIDEAKQKLFIYDPGEWNIAPAKIYTGNLDGSGSLTVIVEAGEFLNSGYDVEVDPDNEFVYWFTSAGSFNNINRSRYDGTGVQTIFTGIPNAGNAFLFDIDKR